MASTLPMQMQKIEVYKDGKLIGYVSKVYGSGTFVNCQIVEKPWKFPQRRATSILRSAKTCTICYMPDKTKIYPKNENVEFKMIEV